jgi:PAS domain S-box-containing protein
MKTSNIDPTSSNNEIKLIQNNIQIEQNQIFITQAPLAIAMFDLNMCYLAASQKWITDYHLEGKNIIGCSHYDLFPEIGEDWKLIHKNCLKGDVNKCDEAPFLRANGTIQWITWEVKPWYTQQQTIGGILMYTSDITDLKKNEQEKLRIEKILNQTNEVAKIGAWELDLITKVVKWSKTTKKIHEVESDFEPKLNTAINFIKKGPSRNLISKAIKKAINKGIGYDIEVELVTAKGNVLWARAIGQAEFIDGKCVKLFGVFQDIDLIKKAEEKLKSVLEITTNQNERLKNFANIVSHNLKSHTNNLDSVLNMFLEENNEFAKNEYLQLLQKAITNLAETISNLNEVVKMNNSIEKLETVNLHQVINNAISHVYQLSVIAKTKININVDPNISVLAIPAYADSIILNFITNGIKYRSTERSPFLNFTVEIINDYVVLNISDNGIGIDLQKNGSKLFGMYKTFTNNPEARGIGLFITKNQIEAIGGKVEVESKINVGTTFKVYFKNAQC